VVFWVQEKRLFFGIWQKKLSEQGKKVGLISNDQAADLVDTAFLQQSGGVTSEVSGSCFCCNYNGFVSAIEDIRIKNEVDVIIAEPVGSCTDLSATIIQPLKDLQKEELEVAPLSVLIDPSRLVAIFNNTNTMHESTEYILSKQLEEADFIVINKIDLLDENEINNLIKLAKERWENAEVFAISGKIGTNLEEWISSVLNSSKSGTLLLDIDYDKYAEGEAVLGWLNTKIKLSGIEYDWENYAEKTLKSLSNRFKKENAAVGHVKLIIDDGENFIIGNITGTNYIPDLKGNIDRSNEVSMILNARVEMNHDDLEKIILEELDNTKNDKLDYSIIELNCLKPGRPNPTHRYTHIKN